MKSLYERMVLFNREFPQLTPLWYDPGRDLVLGFWHISGGRHNRDLYGAYHVEYVRRIRILFPENDVLHLFAGAVPREWGIRVDSRPEMKPDICCRAEQLSLYVKQRPSVIFADPPYSEKDARHYEGHYCNRHLTLRECARITNPGAFVVWLDTVQPSYNTRDWRLNGMITYVCGPSRRIRMVTILCRK